MNTELKHTEYTTWKAPEWKPFFQSVPWLNAPAVDFRFLKNLP